MPDVFINYRNDDGQDVAVAIDVKLSGRFGTERIFYPGKPIASSRPYPQELLRAARTCRVLIATIGPNWLTAADDAGRRRIDAAQDWVRREILVAYEAGAHIVPVVSGRDTRPPGVHELPKPLAWLANLQVLRYRYQSGGPDLDAIADRVAELVPELEDAVYAAAPQTGERQG